jgi:hypothetical protein
MSSDSSSDPKNNGSMITVVASDLNDPNEDDVRGLFRKTEEVRIARVQIPSNTLRENLAAFLTNMSQVIEHLPEQIGGLSIDSLSISMEVSAKGTVSLLGTGGELAGKGGLTLSLKRPPKAQSGPGFSEF